MYQFSNSSRYLLQIWQISIRNIDFWSTYPLRQTPRWAKKNPGPFEFDCNIIDFAHLNSRKPSTNPKPIYKTSPIREVSLKINEQLNKHRNTDSLAKFPAKITRITHYRRSRHQPTWKNLPPPCIFSRNPGPFAQRKSPYVRQSSSPASALPCVLMQERAALVYPTRALIAGSSSNTFPSCTAALTAANSYLPTCHRFEWATLSPAGRLSPGLFGLRVCMYAGERRQRAKREQLVDSSYLMLHRAERKHSSSAAITYQPRSSRYGSVASAGDYRARLEQYCACSWGFWARSRLLGLSVEGEWQGLDEFEYFEHKASRGYWNFRGQFVELWEIFSWLYSELVLFLSILYI